MGVLAASPSGRMAALFHPSQEFRVAKRTIYGTQMPEGLEFAKQESREEGFLDLIRGLAHTRGKSLSTSADCTAHHHFDIERTSIALRGEGVA
jgi:hypothetical protein